MSLDYEEKDHTAAIAQGFLMAGLLFVGVFYIALWWLYKRHYATASPITQHHLKQALIASSLSTGIFVLINLVIMLTDGYASLIGLIGLEVYFMFVVPVFLILGIIAFAKAVNHKDFNFPLIHRFA